jgi:hypothetical protein
LYSEACQLTGGCQVGAGRAEALERARRRLVDDEFFGRYGDGLAIVFGALLVAVLGYAVVQSRKNID